MVEPESGLLTEAPAQQTTQNWYPDEHRELVTQKGWGSVGDSLKSYAELEKSYGGRVKLPTDESTPEEKSAFYTKIGRPDTSDGYDRPQLTEGKAYDEVLIGGMQTAAFEEGLTQKQFAKLVERYLAIETQSAEKQEVENVRLKEETDTELKKQWGADYEKNIEISRRALRELVSGELGEQFSTLIEESGFGNNLVFIQGFREIGSKILDDTLVRGDGQVKVEDDYVPAFQNSPEQYAHGEDDESKKARAYFTKRGHIY